MIPPAPRFYFDVVDPLSFLMDRQLRAAEQELGLSVTRVPFELYAADAPLTDTDDPFWNARWSEAEELAGAADLVLLRPPLVPRPRKAHELFIHASGSGHGSEALSALFDTFFNQGKDIGRVDVLVEIGGALGLDLTETKAVLDVDRYEAEAVASAEGARAEGISDGPTLVAGGSVLQGFHNQAAIGTLLDGV